MLEFEIKYELVVRCKSEMKYIGCIIGRFGTRASTYLILSYLRPPAVRPENIRVILYAIRGLSEEVA